MGLERLYVYLRQHPVHVLLVRNPNATVVKILF